MDNYINLFQVLNPLFNSYIYCKVHLISTRAEAINELRYNSVFNCGLLMQRLENNHLTQNLL